MDGNGALFGTLQVCRMFMTKGKTNFDFQGNTRDVLHKFTVDLPKKHGAEFLMLIQTWWSLPPDIPGRGGQSALRFARLRMEKRHNYVRKVGQHSLFNWSRWSTVSPLFK